MIVFFFGGFLPRTSKTRQNLAQELKDLKATLIFYESPNRLAKSLEDLSLILGAREAAITRELTKKLFEEIRTGSLPTLMSYYQSQPTLKGEIVIVISPPHPTDSVAIELDLDKAIIVCSAAEATLKGSERRDCRFF